ncbi:MAG: TonB-dependent receptor plug domain-containing protein [Verrucomicrobiota bacterium]
MTYRSRKLIRPLQVFAALFAAVQPTFAQAPAAPAPTPPKAKSDAVVLEPFEVVMTEELGYNAPSSGMALRTNEQIMEVPQSISIITRDMINDMGTENISDIIGYQGGSNFFQGDSAMLRGGRVSMYADGVVDYNFDPVTTDSITVVRGPVGVLYGVGAVGNLGGAILKNTRVPTGRNGGSVVLRVDEHGFTRTELDYTRVLAQRGETRFAMRADIAYQRGRFFWDQLSNDRKVGYIVLEMKRPDTTLRFNYTYSNGKADPHRNFFITPEGLPYRSPTDDAYMPPNTKVLRRDRTLRLLLNQKLGTGWNMAVRGAYSRNYYNQSVVLANAINWQTREYILQARNNNLGQRLFSGSVDVTGDYKIFGLKQKSVIGFMGENNSNKPNAFPLDPTFGQFNAARGIGRAVTASGATFIPGNNLLAVPIDNPRSDEIMVRDSAYYFNPAVAGANYGSRQETVTTNVYVQQNVEVIRDRLTIVGSLAQFNRFQESTNRAFVAPASITGTITRAADLLHRVGFIFMVTKDMALYGLESESINPQSARSFDGSFFDPQQGKGREGGVKINFFDGRISATFGVFDIELSNVAVGSGLVSPVSGLAYSINIGKTRQRGADVTLFFRPTPTWQITINGYKGEVTDQDGRTGIPNTFEGSWAIYTRYQFTAEPLKKFAIGGGANRQLTRWISGSSMRLPDGTVAPSNGTPGIASAFKIKDGTQTQAFISYNPNKKWAVQLHVNNIFDDWFAVGHQHAAAIDPYQPRTTQVVVTYRF